MISSRLTPGTVAIGYGLVAAACVVVLEVLMTPFMAHEGAWLIELLLQLTIVCGTAYLIYFAFSHLEKASREGEGDRIGELKRSTEELSRSNRLFAVLARVNEGALRAEDRVRLCEQICEVLVETGGMRLAWIGTITDAGQITLEASAGEKAYLAGMVTSILPDRPEAHGPTGRALLEGISQVCVDFERDERMRPWLERARAHGIRSSAAIPFKVPDGLSGAICVYSEQADVFTPDCVRLLEQLSADLVGGLTVIRSRADLAIQAAALAESEGRYRGLFEQSSAVMFVLDPNSGQILDANVAATEFYGWDRERLRSMRIFDLNVMPPDDLAALMQGAVNRGRGTFHFRHRLAGGDVRDVEVHSGPLVLDGRTVLFSVIHDISERVRMEESLRASEARLNFALNRSHTGGWLLNLDDGATIRTLEHDRIFGYSELLPSWGYEQFREHVLPEDRAAVDEVFFGALRHKDDWSFECRIRRTDGAIRWIWIAGGRLPEAPGQGPRMSGIVQDITGRREAEERLRDSEARLKLALQAGQQGIYDLDLRTGCAIVSSEYATMIGHAPESFVETNQDWLERLHPDDRSRAVALFDDYVAGRVPDYKVEFRQRTASGQWKWTLSIGRIVERATDGTPLRMIGTHTDISEIKALEHRLLRSQRMESVGLLAGGIAHDLNNVLAPILLSVDLLRLRARDAAERRTIEVIDASAKRGAGIVRQVLTFARGIDGERVPLRASDVVREVCLIAAETFPRNINLLRECCMEDSRVLGDATQLHQVLLNLAVNARDAMPEGGTLAFRTLEVVLERPTVLFTGELPAGRYVMIAVRDTGPGISAEVRERIFDPFFTTKPQGKGTGLGLPTALGIVRSHGGLVDLANDFDSGTEFRVYLPAYEEPHIPKQEASTAAIISGAGRGLLLCDDEESIREVAAIVLEQAGFKVFKASDGTEAVDLFARHRDEIEVLVIDLMMPSMNGDEAAARMLRMRSDLRVLFMSGLVERDSIDQSMAVVGATRYTLLRKPFVVQDLLLQLSELVGNKA